MEEMGLENPDVECKRFVRDIGDPMGRSSKLSQKPLVFFGHLRHSQFREDTHLSTFHVAFSEAGEKAKQQQSVAICEESSERDGLGTGVPNVSQLTLRRSPCCTTSGRSGMPELSHLHCFF